MKLPNTIDQAKKEKYERVKGKLKRVQKIASVILLLLFVLALSVGCVKQSEINDYIAAHPDEIAAANTDNVGGDGAATVTDASATNAIAQTGEGAAGEGEEGGIISMLNTLFKSRSQALQIIALLTVLSIVPSILIMLTGFVRIVMILSFTRNAMGLQQMPPNQVVIALALFLTFFIMAPVLDEIKTEAYIPYAAGAIELDEAMERGEAPLKRFMLKQTRTTDLGVFYSYAGEEVPEDPEDTPMRILIPAFMTSELKWAFEIGFLIYIPFIVIDMIVASVLMSMGMMMLPPVTISLPFKVLVFVVVDGWMLTVQSILTSFG